MIYKQTRYVTTVTLPVASKGRSRQERLRCGQSVPVCHPFP